MPNKFSQIWQELKRRNVVRVITVYAGAAFVLLELVDIIKEPLKLPDWLLPVVIVLLSVGFIIAVILSWIYDIHPEGGVVKTEQADKVKIDEIPTSSNSWKIASYFSFVVIVGLIVLNIIPRTNASKEVEILDKSITVLPFISLSDDPEKQYLADGIMDAILLHLSKIEDLRVLARTTSEKYRDTDKTATEICQELGVSFALEGSFRQYGDQARLIVQLIRSGKEDHAWAKQYDREWKEIFAVESEVAQAIAKELQAVITPEEKQLIEKTPTTSLTAYDLYQRGRDEHNQYRSDNDNRTALERAEELYHNALDYDSTFALAYTGLAYVYWNKHYWESYFSESFLDSVLILADKALSFDPQLSDAHTVRGGYYRAKGQAEQAISEYEKALKLNPNNWEAYAGVGNTYGSSFNLDCVKQIENFHKAASLNRGPELPYLLRILADPYLLSGFVEKYLFYHHEAFILDGDSIIYLTSLGISETWSGYNNKDGTSLELAYLMDTTRSGNLLHMVGTVYGFEGKYEKSLIYLKKYYERLDDRGGYWVQGMQRLGYAYWMNGFHTEANMYFDRMIEYYNNLTEVERPLATTNYDLAGIFAFRGEKDRAYEHLRKFNELETIPLWWRNLIMVDPFFDNIRDEPEFQQIVRDVEAKYQAEHERVRQWLEENDML